MFWTSPLPKLASGSPQANSGDGAQRLVPEGDSSPGGASTSKQHHKVTSRRSAASGRPMVLFFLSKSEDSRGSSDLVMSQSWVRYEHSRQKQNLSEGVFFWRGRSQACTWFAAGKFRRRRSGAAMKCSIRPPALPAFRELWAHCTARSASHTAPRLSPAYTA